MIGPRRAWSGWLDGGHLSLDVVVALVDGELAAGPAHRAMAHVDHCLQCAAEVTAQRQARRRLRGAGVPGAPTSLLSSLRAIPTSADLPPAPGTLALDAEGRFVVRADAPDGDGPDASGGSADAPRTDTARTDTAEPSSRDVGPPAGMPAEGTGPGGTGGTGGARPRRRTRRRLAVGLPAAVASGLALGAVTLAAPAASPAGPPVGARPASVVPAPSRAATSPTVAQAELTLGGTTRTETRALPGPGAP